MRLNLALTAAAVLISTTPLAFAAGDAAAGKQLAERSCASCHQVEPSGTARDTAPPFPALAKKGGKDLGWARAWLANPHPPMQGIDLSRQQTDDIIAYLQSLAPKP
ncbi:MAG TPA: cytochrome c [Stellaceae bacterium]|nr:cytochrome c [Stellaceae bacterium]